MEAQMGWKQGQEPIDRESMPYPNDWLGSDIRKVTCDPEHHVTMWITRNAVDFIERQSKERPWFFHLSYNHPHSPSELPEPYWSLWKDGFDQIELEVPRVWPHDHVLQEKREKNVNARLLINPEKDTELFLDMLRAYLVMVKMIDDELEKVMDALEAKGMKENTLIVFTSDHGNMCGDHGRWFKKLPYEGASHVPLLMYIPEGITPGVMNGRTIDQLVESTDIMPTLLDLIGVKDKVHGMQGQSLLPLLRGDTHEWKNEVFMDDAVIEGDYKFVYNSEGSSKLNPEWKKTFEIYNLRTDPHESINLADVPEIKSRLPRIKRRHEDWKSADPGPMSVDGMATPEYAKLPRPERAFK
jgi:arylsulfatase A-like enzyme